MSQFRVQYFRSHLNNQKTPDIVFDVKVNDKKSMDKWNDEERKNLEIFIQKCEERFNVFKKGISQHYIKK